MQLLMSHQTPTDILGGMGKGLSAHMPGIPLQQSRWTGWDEPDWSACLATQSDC